MHRSSPARPVALVLVATLAAGASQASDWRELMTDPQDGRFDTSRWLLQRRGFLPVPIIITEPAIGYGGGLALAFFHHRNMPEGDASPAPSSTADGTADEHPHFTPPSVTGVMAAATENGTKLGGLAHLGIWRNNTVRYTGALAAMDINLTFYGGEDFPRLSDGVGYNMKGWATFQQVIWKLGTSDFWIGPQLIYLDSTTKLDQHDAPPVFDRLGGDVENLGAGVVVQYDTRDNIFTPSRGFQSEWYVREHWGSFHDDFEYTEVDGKNRWFFNPGPKWVLGWRVDANYTTDEAPFYALPSINQRGIAKGRYQGDAVVTTELEARYDIDGRWFGVAFAGVGRAADSLGELDDVDSHWAGGVGVRYLLARLLGLQAGIDVAKGPEEWTFYLQVGSGWGM